MAFFLALHPLPAGRLAGPSPCGEECQLFESSVKLKDL